MDLRVIAAASVAFAIGAGSGFSCGSWTATGIADSFAGLASIESPPGVDEPIAIERSHFAFEYPWNWTMKRYLRKLWHSFSGPKLQLLLMSSPDPTGIHSW